MKRIVLGKTGIETSYLGIGTSWAYEGVLCPAKLKIADYPELLCFAYEHGVTLWDTSLTYGTHAAIKEALKNIPRHNVAICSKSVEVSYKKMWASVEGSLRDMATDYIDIFMLHAVRNKFDPWYRSGALEALKGLKEKGYIRAIGIASHGLGALEKCIDLGEIDIILGRVNYSGHLMDSRQDDIKSVLAGMPAFKKVLMKILPERIFTKAASTVQKSIASEDDRKSALRLFQQLHESGKHIIGMKIFGEGNLAHDIQGAVSYVMSLPFVTSIIVGCCSKKELLETVGAVNSDMRAF